MLKNTKKAVKSLVLWKKAVPLHPLPNNGAQDKRSLKRLHKQTE